jgi:hypothetical protein
MIEVLETEKVQGNEILILMMAKEISKITDD